MNLRFALLGLGLLVAPGCSSSNFEVATPESDAGADTSQNETAVADSTPSEDAVSPPGDAGGPACSVESDPVTIWVDAASTIASPTGTTDCPFARIVDAVAFVKKLPPKPRTIRVRSGEYAELEGIILEKGMTLLGNGPKTVISGGGNCYGTSGYPCVVRVTGGAILDGVTIDAGPASKTGVIADDLIPTSTPIVRNTTVTGASGDGTAGILIMGSAVLGPNIVVVKNRVGVNIWGHQTVKVLAGANKFDENVSAGILHEGNGVLAFEGGSVSGNGSGIKLGPPATALAVPPQHDIQNLVARDNAEAGIRVSTGNSLRLRKSTITGGKFGVVALFGGNNRIDLGRPDEVGGNNFGGGGTRPLLAAICAQGTTAVPMPAVGNRYPDCISKQVLANGASCETATSYADLWWRGLSEPDVSSCAKGP